MRVQGRTRRAVFGDGAAATVACDGRHDREAVARVQTAGRVSIAPRCVEGTMYDFSVSDRAGACASRDGPLPCQWSDRAGPDTVRNGLFTKASVSIRARKAVYKHLHRVSKCRGRYGMEPTMHGAGSDGAGYRPDEIAQASVSVRSRPDAFRNGWCKLRCLCGQGAYAFQQGLYMIRYPTDPNWYAVYKLRYRTGKCRNHSGMEFKLQGFGSDGPGPGPNRIG